eukprot:Rmarinus@m.19541
MANRNLTSQFVRCRDAYRARRPSFNTYDERSDKVGLLEKKYDGKKVIELEDLEEGKSRRPALPPSWVDVRDDFTWTLTKIQENMDQIRDLHRRRLIPRFDDDHKELDRDINQLTQETTKLFHRCEKRVVDLKPKGDDTIHNKDDAVRTNVQRSYAGQLQQMSLRFRKMQKTYVERLKGLDQGTDYDVKASTPAPSLMADFEMDMMVVSDDSVLTLAKEREQEIAVVAEGVHELGALIKDLAMLVIDQGTILDRIDYNVEMVVEATEHAAHELDIAHDRQKKGHALWCIICLSVTCASLIIVLILKHS